MRPLCFSRVFIFLSLLLVQLHAAHTEKSAALYYGDDISYSNLGIHDYIIVESDNISSYTHGFKTYKDKIYAYVSIGEASEYRKHFDGLKAEWKLSQNKAWKSTVLDVSNDAYHEYMYEQVIQPLVNKGYKNFFFDTLDSYQLAAKNEEQRQEFEKGLIRFIVKFKRRFSNTKLIVNRGFEILDQIHMHIDGLLVESLFYGLSLPDLAYKKVSEQDRQWLLSQIQKAQKYGLDVISVEYISLKEKAKIRTTIEQLKNLGVIPYVSNKELTRYGQSSKEPIKREVLVLYSATSTKQYSNAHRLLSLPLEHLGYIPVVKAISGEFPNMEEMSRYKGVVVWNEAPFDATDAYETWIKSLVDAKIKVLFLDGFGVSDDTSICELLGIKKQTNRAGLFEKVQIGHKADIFDYETPLGVEYFETLYRLKEGETLLSQVNVYGQENTLVATAPWGGYALNGTVSKEFGVDALWILNPFDFFPKALDLAPIPVPDPTTENGRRLLFSHIDGDAAMNRVEWNPRLYSIEVMYEHILKKYTIPHGVSIVEAEISAEGLYPKDAAKLQKAARNIYALEHVEAASHTYTHPFEWERVKEGKLDPQYRLGVKEYDFSIDREISGSLEYINSRLLPAGKKAAKTVYWTGDCVPPEEVLAYTYKHGLLNINGGNTLITNDKPWLSRIAPYSLKRGEYRQVYTGAENENVYTNMWHGPFWGYKKVIQTFKRTESPRRLKPIDIYYHFYAASKTASLKALDEVYTWALSQEVMPIYPSEYIPKVLEFYDLSMAKSVDGWYIEGMDALNTLRSDTAGTMDRLKQNASVIGYRTQGDRTYIHVNTQKQPVVLQSRGEEESNHLIHTNARVSNYMQNEQGISFHLKGYVDIELDYHLKEGCSIRSSIKPGDHRISGAEHSLKFRVKESDVFIRCR